MNKITKEQLQQMRLMCMELEGMSDHPDLQPSLDAAHHHLEKAIEIIEQCPGEYMLNNFWNQELAQLVEQNKVPLGKEMAYVIDREENGDYELLIYTKSKKDYRFILGDFYYSMDHEYKADLCELKRLGYQIKD